jgi:hypothetical protein
MRKRPTLFPPPEPTPLFFFPHFMSTPSACLRFSGSCPVSATSTFRANATQRNTTQRNATFAVSLKNMPPAPVPHPTLPRPSSSLPPRLASLSFSPAPAVVLVFVYCCLLSSVFCLLSSVFRLPSSASACPCPGSAPACPGYLPQCAPLPSSSSSFAYATPCPPPPFQFNSTTCLLAAAVSSYCLLLRCSIAPPAPCMFCVSYQIDPAPQASNCQFYSPLAPHLFCSIFCFASPPAAAAPLCQLYYIPPRPRRVNCVTHAKNDNNPKTKKEKHHFTSNNKTNFIRYESYLPMYLSQSLLLRREIFFSCCMHSLEFLKWVTTVRRP